MSSLMQRLSIDRLVNMVTGLGRYSKNLANGYFGRRRQIDWTELDNLYEQSGVAARIVDRVVDDAMRGDIRFADGDVEWIKEWHRLGVDANIGDSWRWGRLYGAALLIGDFNDGVHMSQPLNTQTATQLRRVFIAEAPYVSPVVGGRTPRPLSAPEAYLVALPHSMLGSTTIHHTRTIRFDSMRVTPSRMAFRGGFAPSVIERPFDDIVRLDSAMQYAHGIMHDISMRVYKFQGLRQQLTTDKGRAEAKAVFAAIEEALSTLGILPIDSKDDYMEVTRTVTGLKELLESFVDALVRNTDMPRVVILGEQPGGINAGADSEIRAWYDFVQVHRREYLTPKVIKVRNWINMVRGNRGESVVHTPPMYERLWQPTEKEQAEIDLLRAQAAEVRLTNSLSTPEQEKLYLWNKTTGI